MVQGRYIRNLHNFVKLSTEVSGSNVNNKALFRMGRTLQYSVFVNKYMKVPGVSYLKVSFILISAISCRNVFFYNNEVKSNKHLVLVV